MSAKMKAFFSETYAAFDESKTINVSLKVMLFASTVTLIYNQGKAVLSVEKYSFPKSKNIFDSVGLEAILSEVISDKAATIEFIYSGLDFCLVPKSIYKNDLIPTLFDFLAKDEVNSIYRSEEISKMQAFACYGIQENIFNLLSNFSKSVKITHNSTSLVEYLLNQTQFDQLHLRISDQSFECVLLQNNKLMLFNQFKFKTLEEFVYYVMSIFNSFSLEAMNFPIVLSGTITVDSKIIELLNKYVKNVQFANTSPYSVAFAKEISLSCFPHLEF